MRYRVILDWSLSSHGRRTVNRSSHQLLREVADLRVTCRHLSEYKRKPCMVGLL